MQHNTRDRRIAPESHLEMEAYEAGRATYDHARSAEEAKAANPYPAFSRRWACFNRGWNDEKRENARWR